GACATPRDEGLEPAHARVLRLRARLADRSATGRAAARGDRIGRRGLAPGAAKALLAAPGCCADPRARGHPRARSLALRVRQRPVVLSSAPQRRERNEVIYIQTDAEFAA